MTALYRNATLRKIEAVCASQPLMARAGTAAARWAAELAPDTALPILVLAGPGNNGGDAFEAAHRLQECRPNVHLVFAGNPARLPADAGAAHRRFYEAGGACLPAVPAVQRWGLIIDGLFGIGLARAPAGIHSDLIREANALAARDRCPLLALDCPSGLDTDTGRVFDPAIEASHTITFIAAKPGLHTADGPDHCGEIRVAPLDLAPEQIAPPDGRLVTPAAFAAHLKPRRRNSHKGSYGSVGILGGAESMLGAAFLAGRAALKLGSGRVYLGLLDPRSPTWDPNQPELMLRRPEGMLEAGLNAIACGPGLGTSPAARKLVRRVLSLDQPLVLDADALNILALEPELRTGPGLNSGPGSPSDFRRLPLLLTPHPAEAARLLGTDVAAVQADRIEAARTLAARYGAQIALKGCGTVIATPEGDWWINGTGNPGMAAAGMGDTLTGIAAALLGQGWPATEALLAAVHLHGAAGDAAVARGLGPAGLTASELTDCARELFNQWSAVA